MSFALICLCLLALNGLAFLAFAYDKAQARAKGWRVAESKLLLLALLGGSIGAVLAQQILRHKTRKEPFRTWLQIIIVVQAGLMIGFIIL